MALTSDFNGTKWSIEQYPPGYYSKYQIGPDFKIKLVEEKRYYQIGAVPKFTPWVNYEGTGFQNLLWTLTTLFPG